MDTKKLRQKILDLAIHGKLVPQDPNDEPASVLLERIRAEKEKLIKEGKIKAPKKSKSAGDTSHYPKEGPWELPEGWCWTTIGDCLINRDGERIPISSEIRIKQKNKVFDYYGAAGVIDKVDDYLFNERLLLIGEDGANLLSRAKDNAFFAEGKYWVNNHAHILDATRKPLLDYIALYINSIALDPYITGSAQPKLNQDNLNRIPVPLPPFMEQLRIIDSMAKSQVIIDIIAEKQKEIVNAISLAKSKILDLAIHGKLVPQDPSDEPAIELLKRINPGFRPSDNLHYEVDLPEGWVLCTLSEASNYGQCISVPVDTIENDAWVLELEDIEKDSGRLIRKLAKTERNISGIRHRFQKGQVLYSKLRTYLNKVLLAPDDGYCTTEIVPITPIKGLDPQYLNIVLRSPYFLNYTVQCGYGVKMPRLGTNDGRKAVIPIPPIAEQHRIVNKTNQLMSELELIATLNDVKVAE